MQIQERFRREPHRRNDSRSTPESRPWHSVGHGKLPGTNHDGLPWSHRRSPIVRLLICILCGVMAGAVGTMAHRMGASRDIPYGLVLALVIVGLSTWCARSRSGVSGLAWHLIMSSATAWCMAIVSPGGGSLTPVGFGGPVPYFSAHVGYLWLYGMIAVQIVLLMCPSSWFAMTTGTSSRRVSAPSR